MLSLIPLTWLPGFALDELGFSWRLQLVAARQLTNWTLFSTTHRCRTQRRTYLASSLANNHSNITLVAGGMEESAKQHTFRAIFESFESEV